MIGVSFLRRMVMLTEQRYEIILGLLREKNSVTVTELKDILEASESTVRRDITALYKAGKLTRVFGGAVALEQKVNAYEPTVAQKSELNTEEKKKIAVYAASLIKPEDFVYKMRKMKNNIMMILIKIIIMSESKNTKKWKMNMNTKMKNIKKMMIMDLFLKQSKINKNIQLI